MKELGGSIARQIAMLAIRYTPYHKHHAQFMNLGWPRGSDLSAFLISGSSNPVLSGNLAFLADFVILGF